MPKKRDDLIPKGMLLIADNISSRDNIFGASPGAKAEWAKGLNLPRRNKTIFFAGCGYQYLRHAKTMLDALSKFEKRGLDPEKTIGIAKAFKKVGIDLTAVYSKLPLGGDDHYSKALNCAVNVLTKLGVDFGYLHEEEPCCGAPLYFFGLEAEFAKHCQETYGKLKSLGVKQIIGLVPSCTNALRNLFPNYVADFDIEVKHFCQVVWERIKEGNISLEMPQEVEVTYHDPCQLARYLGVIDEPRQVLNSIKGLELKEPEWTTGEWATCCGGGGGFEMVFPELSHILAVNRARELVETNPSMIITHCPACVMQLEEGLKDLRRNHLEVLDLAQVVDRALRR